MLAGCGSHGTAVDSIWTARYVVTMDPQRRVIEDGAVAISGDHIVAAGPRQEIDAAYSRRNGSIAATRSWLRD